MSKPENAEMIALRDQVDRLQERCGRLQAGLDEQGQNLVKTVSDGIHDAASASDALETFDAEWFSALLYSRPVVRAIAKRLLDAVVPYPFLDATHVRAFAEENPA